MKLNQQDIKDMEQRYRANFINSLSGFKSANLVGTANAQGQTNLCIVSSVFHVGANPPLLGMIMRPHTVVRDTLQNIKDTGEYTINHIPANLFENAHQTSARYPADVSEFDTCRFTEEHSEVHNAPYVKESQVKIGLKARQISLIELNNTELVIGEIVEVVVEPAIVEKDGYVDLEKAQIACISGLDSYHKTRRLDRLSYAKPNESSVSILSDLERKD